MPHTIKFTDSDEDKALIKRIDEYQKQNKLPNRTETIRHLCDIALCSKELIRKLDNKR